MNLTLDVSRDVILDLAPLYLGGDASTATRTLVDAYLARDHELALWMREQQLTVFAPLLDNAPPDTGLTALRRARRRLAVQRWFFGLGLFFVALSLTTEFTTYRGRIVELHLVARDHPVAGVLSVALAVLCLAVYAVLRRQAFLLLLIGVVITLALPSPSQAQGDRELRIDAAHSTIEFAIPFAYGNVRGRFDDVSGWLIFPDSTQGDMSTSSVAAIIRTASINTGSAHRDEHLRSSDFFDAARFPTMTFQSDRVDATASGFELTGPLTIHGRTRIVSIPCRLTLPPTTDPHHVIIAVVTGGTTLARRDFDIVGGSEHNAWFDKLRSATMGDSVRVSLEMHLWAPDFSNPDSVLRASLARIDSVGIDSAIVRLRAAFTRDSAAFVAAAYSLDLIGETLLARNQTRDGFLWLHALARLMPHSADAMVSVGLANERLGDIARAAIWYRQALTADSLNARARARILRLERAHALTR